jgi:hypothetical protein
LLAKEKRKKTLLGIRIQQEFFFLKGLSYEKDWASLNMKKQSRA